jgi:hypothetical protein
MKDRTAGGGTRRSVVAGGLAAVVAPAVLRVVPANAQIDWQQGIVELTAVKREIAALDTGGLWPHYPANPPATEAELAAAEAAIGEPLDAQYRGLLSHAAGWPAFWHTTDLFGPADLRGSASFREASQLLGYVESIVLEQGNLQRASLLPIAASSTDIDLFVMTRAAAPRPGTVIWLAGAEIKRYRDFSDYFQAMIELNRAELDHFRTKP